MRMFALLFVCTLAAYAQSSSRYWRFQLPGGAYVSFISGDTIVSAPAGVSLYEAPDLTGSARLYGNTIEHALEEDGRQVLAYRLRIEPSGDVAYVVTIDPVPGAPFFPQAPKPLRLSDGQRAEIELATSKDGHVKAFASIQISKYEQRLSSLPHRWAEPRDLTLDALKLMVSAAQVFKNNVRIAEHAGGASSSILVAYLPGVGRVLFSVLPQKGFDFTKTAVVENNRIIFDINSDHYEIASRGPVIGQPGAWKIYMLRAPGTTPCRLNIDVSKPLVWARTLTQDWLNCQGPMDQVP